MALIIATFLIVDIGLVAGGGVSVDWSGYAMVVLCGSGVLGVGLAYRLSGRDEKIALAAISAGLFVLFTIVGSALNYLVIPAGTERIDPLLIRLDAVLGYSWPALVVWVAEFPALGSLLRWTYLSSLPQFVIVILVLGMTGRRDLLHGFLLTGILAAIVTIAFWLVFPSSGPSAFFPIPAEAVAKLGMVVSPDYGAELNRLMGEGVTHLSPTDTLGLIAFPSFHTVMALMSIWFMRTIRPLFPLFVIVNMLMLPAILVHGGHHFVDLFGGLAAFAIGHALAQSLLSGATASGKPDLAGVGEEARSESGFQSGGIT
ncbi:hypothetical protein NA2_06607 [Nitratireductor pacificus pht-3B]|uniref:Inositolphosphotransferase Aur1/Ipt1 domain-containing protein n=1 Tax=Nitratireductor pacificus pht-3B TaxID=391937 RepID=K2LP99_9HYPH|nr:hypothetical protein NA2_06607 [Nitratireductor pacificus pht-3B]